MSVLTSRTKWNPELDKMLVYMRDTYDLSTDDMGIENLSIEKSLHKMEEIDREMKNFYLELSKKQDNQETEYEDDGIEEIEGEEIVIEDEQKETGLETKNEVMISTVYNKDTKEYDLVEHYYPIFYQEIPAKNIKARCENLNNKYGVGLKPASAWVVVGSDLHKFLKNLCIPAWKHCID
jgi:hypothetical protein